MSSALPLLPSICTLTKWSYALSFTGDSRSIQPSNPQLDCYLQPLIYLNERMTSPSLLVCRVSQACVVTWPAADLRTPGRPRHSPRSGDCAGRSLDCDGLARCVCCVSHLGQLLLATRCERDPLLSPHDLSIWQEGCSQRFATFWTVLSWLLIATNELTISYIGAMLRRLTLRANAIGRPAVRLWLPRHMASPKDLETSSPGGWMASSCVFQHFLDAV